MSDETLDLAADVGAMERAVIAALVLDSSVLRFAVDLVAGEDFADPRLGDVFERIVSMAAMREPVDVLIVGEKLAEWGIRGIRPEDLHGWVSELPTAANVGFYAERVREAAVRRAIHAEGVRLAQVAAGNQPGEVLARSIERLQSLRDARTVADVRPRRLGSLLEGDDEYDWVIPDLLERGDRLLLTGQEGGGKTTLVRQLAILSSAGIHPMTFFPMEPAKVLVVDAENSEKQWRRQVRSMVTRAALRGKVNPADELAIACIARLDLTRDQDLAMIHRMIDHARPDVLFIGPLYRLIPRAINSDDDAAPLLAALDTLRARGLALVIEAHAGHSVGAGGERDMRPRGSAALLGWPEFGFGLRVDKGGRSSNEFQLVRWRGDRDERKWPFRIARGVSDWPWTPTAGGR